MEKNSFGEKTLKKNHKSKKIKNNRIFNNINKRSFAKKIQNIIREEKKNYIKSIEPMATRKSSEKILNVL